MTANNARTRKAKGSKLEHWLAAELRRTGADPGARRMPMSGALAHFKSDIFTKLPYAFECKNQENTKVWEWYEQAKEQKSGLEKPIVVFKRNYSEPMALLSAADLIDMIAEIQDLYREQKETRR